MFNENSVLQRQTEKIAKFYTNGQMRFFMASALQKWPNFLRLAIIGTLATLESHNEMYGSLSKQTCS